MPEKLWLHMCILWTLLFPEMRTYALYFTFTFHALAGLHLGASLFDVSHLGSSNLLKGILKNLREQTRMLHHICTLSGQNFWPFIAPSNWTFVSVMCHFFQYPSDHFYMLNLIGKNWRINQLLVQVMCFCRCHRTNQLTETLPKSVTCLKCTVMDYFQISLSLF